MLGCGSNSECLVLDRGLLSLPGRHSVHTEGLAKGRGDTAQLVRQRESGRLAHKTQHGGGEARGDDGLHEPWERRTSVQGVVGQWAGEARHKECGPGGPFITFFFAVDTRDQNFEFFVDASSRDATSMRGFCRLLLTRVKRASELMSHG